MQLVSGADVLARNGYAAAVANAGGASELGRVQTTAYWKENTGREIS